MKSRRPRNHCFGTFLWVVLSLHFIKSNFLSETVFFYPHTDLSKKRISSWKRTVIFKKTHSVTVYTETKNQIISYISNSCTFDLHIFSGPNITCVLHFFFFSFEGGFMFLLSFSLSPESSLLKSLIYKLIGLI